MKFFLAILCSSFSLVCHAQCKYGIVKSYGYWRPEYAGNIPKDEPHHGPDTLYIVYLEVKKSVKPVWKTAFMGKRQFNVIQAKATPPVQPGVLVSHADTIELHTKKGNRMWQLTLEKSDAVPVKNNNGDNELFLKGKWQGKPAIYGIKKIKALRPVLTM